MAKSKLLWLLASGVLNSGGAVLAPELTVYGGASSDVLIADGDVSPATADGTDFGLIAYTSGGESNIFRLSNSGNDTLSITDIDVPHENDSFFPTDTDDAPLAFPIEIAPASHFDLKILFSPVSPDAFSGTVTISGDDIEDYSFAITGSALYSARVLALSPMRYNKLDEASGTTMVDVGGSAFTGTYTGIAWGAGASPLQGGDAPFFDGTNDYANLYSAAFASAFNMDEYTVMLWVKMSALADWTDGVAHTFLRLQRDASNEVRLSKNSNNTIRFLAIGGGTTKSIDLGSQSQTDWFCVALSRSIAGGGLLSAGDTRAYKNGVQAGSTQTGSVAATGSGLNSTNTALGSLLNNSATSAQKGYLAHLIVWNSPMSNDKLALMAV